MKTYDTPNAVIRYAYCGRGGYAACRWLIEFKDSRQARWARTLKDAKRIAAQ